MNWHWLLIPSHLLFFVAGALVYRKNLPRIARWRSQFQALADIFDRSK